MTEEIIILNDNVKIIKQENNVVLYVDGLPQMIIPRDERRIQNLGEILFVQPIDLLKHKKNIKVLNVGLGAGYTAKEILKRDFVSKLDIVEIYKTVIDSLKHFETSDVLLNNKRVAIINQNIIDYLKTTNEVYDCIVVDVCQPKLEITKGLFDEEFFNSIKKHLTKDGICLYWFYTIKYRKEMVERAKNVINYSNKLFSNVSLNTSTEDFGETTYFFMSDKYEHNKNTINIFDL